jgi:hypothetical protein
MVRDKIAEGRAEANINHIRGMRGSECGASGIPKNPLL